MTLPDGTVTEAYLPALETYEVFKMNLNWTVPEGTAIGNLELRWEADTNGVNTADANLQNNIATVDLFVGRVPTPVVANSTGMTNENIVLDATCTDYKSDRAHVEALANSRRRR